MYKLTPEKPVKRGCLRWLLVAVLTLAILVVSVVAFRIDSSIMTSKLNEIDSTATAVVLAQAAIVTDTPFPTSTPPPPSDTPLPTATSTATSLPTNTPLPSATPTITWTPVPTASPAPTSTPIPTATLDPSVPRTDVESRIACNMSEYFVKQKLKSPSTAKFPGFFDEPCMALFNNGVWTISSWVDSQNGFGAMIRSHYVAQLTHDDDGSMPAAADATWHLKGLLFVD